MARFRRAKPEARDRMLSFRASASEVAYLRAVAARRGTSVADLLREALDDFVAKVDHKGDRR